MDELPDVQLSAEAQCTLAGLGLKEALKHNLATAAYGQEPTEAGADSLRALRNLAWQAFPEMADVLADILGYYDGKSKAV